MVGVLWRSGRGGRWRGVGGGGRFGDGELSEACVPLLADGELFGAALGESAGEGVDPGDSRGDSCGEASAEIAVGGDLAEHPEGLTALVEGGVLHLEVFIEPGAFVADLLGTIRDFAEAGH